MAWTIFYRGVVKLNFASDNNKHIGHVQELLNKLAYSGFGALTYFRWDDQDEMYKRFEGKTN